ncbi:MAG: 50S ribosomal protein L14e [Candidatus Bathyarchaeota archaeon]|nr:50S ribosomal protein L14e [Candidatus Bathyarchaeota archaeon]
MSVTQLFDVGRVCIKKVGREAGKRCVVVDIIDKNFVLITGPKELTGVKRRRVNVDHLEPLDVKLNIKRGADDKEVAKALRKAFPEDYPKAVEEVKEEKEKTVESGGKS